VSRLATTEHPDWIAPLIPQPMRTARAVPRSVHWRAVEFVVLFFAVPGLAAVDLLPGKAVFPLLFVGCGICLTMLLLDRRFRRRQLWNFRAVERQWKAVVLPFVIGAALLTVWTLAFDRDLLLRLPREKPGLWLMIMCFYPLVSVYPQEVIYRAFVFHRYRRLFPQAWMRIAASAVAFGWVHVLFYNAFAVVLTLLGGVLFAWTYERSRSLLAVSIEHALYGCYLFTIGLGWYFYSGSRAAVEAAANAAGG